MGSGKGYEVLHKVDNISDAKEAVIARAVELMNYEEQTSRLIGEYGEKLIDNGDAVLDTLQRRLSGNSRIRNCSGAHQVSP